MQNFCKSSNIKAIILLKADHPSIFLQSSSGERGKITFSRVQNLGVSKIIIHFSLSVHRNNKSKVLYISSMKLGGRNLLSSLWNDRNGNRTEDTLGKWNRQTDQPQTRCSNTCLPLPYIWIHFDSMTSKSHHHSLHHDKTCSFVLFLSCFGFSFRTPWFPIILNIGTFHLSMNCIKIQWNLTKLGLDRRPDLHLWIIITRKR